MNIVIEDISNLVFKTRTRTIINSNNYWLDLKTLELFFEFDGKKNIRAISNKTNIDIREIKKKLSKLLNYKLIELKTENYILNSDLSFFKQLESHLTPIVGSISNQLIKEVITGMDLTINNFPQNKNVNLIYKLSLHIPNLRKRSKFSYEMLETLNTPSNIEPIELVSKTNFIARALRSMQIVDILPGFCTTLILALLSVWISEIIGVKIMGFAKSPISPVMITIIAGIIISNLFTLPDNLKPGFKFSIDKALKVGIILLGIRLSILHIFKLGLFGLPIIVFCIVSAILFTTCLNDYLKLPQKLGTLIAVGTSICGVTAIVATGPTIKAKEEEITYAIAVITIFGIIATVFYPYLANFIFSGDPVKSGLFLGTAIHDTSQVAGAGLVFADIFSKPKALDVATVAKLVRNVFMTITIPIMSYYYSKKSSNNVTGKKISTHMIPFFIFGFLFFSLIRSIGDAGINSGFSAFGLWDMESWQSICDVIKQTAGYFLVIALAGVGLNTNLRSLKGMGIKPFIVGMFAAVVVSIVSILSISILSGFIKL